MIPLKAELRLAYKPVVTYAIVVVCIIIYAFQYNNNKEINRAASAYCSGLAAVRDEVNELDILSSYPSVCPQMLASYYGLADKKHIPHFFIKDYRNFSAYFSEYRQYGYQEALAFFEDHMKKFSDYAPINLDGALVYDPSTFNLFTMVTSVLSHGSLGHIFFNLVFFLAFAPALEALVGNSWRFLGVIGLMILGTNLIYALSMLSQSYPTPTLGLSGIVAGVMGFAASFMPKARIKTFYYVVVLPTPVWLLSAYYIGWDIYDLYSRTDHGGVNVVVHVAGGIIGVLMMMLFRNRQEEISEQLHDEIEYMQKKRTTLVDDERTKTEIATQLKLEKNQQQEQQYINQLYALARVHKHADIINELLRDYDPAHSVVERYEYIFSEIKQWTTGRSFICIGCLIIEYRLNQRHTGGALRIAAEIFETNKDILIANPEHVLMLAQAAKEVNNFELAYAIIKDAEKRYHGKCNGEIYLFMELELLHLYLNKSQQALVLLKSIFDNREHPYRNAVLMHAKSIGLIGNSGKKTNA